MNTSTTSIPDLNAQLFLQLSNIADNESYLQQTLDFIVGLAKSENRTNARGKVYMIPDSENVARAIFSPRMIVDGEIQPEAFRLRASISEDYLSVMRVAIPSWMDDIKLIPQRQNRQLYGYAEMNVGDIRGIQMNNAKYDVRELLNETLASHAGVFIFVNGENLVGGKHIESIQNGEEQDFLLLAIQRELVEIAQKGLHRISNHN